MTQTAATATRTFEPGAVVRAPHYQGGKSTGVRKGVVLRPYAEDGDPKGGYLVYYYTLGPAVVDGRGNAATVGVVFPDEMAPSGDLFDLSERTLLKIGGGLRDWGTGRRVRNLAGRACALKRSARKG